MSEETSSSSSSSLSYQITTTKQPMEELYDDDEDDMNIQKKKNSTATAPKSSSSSSSAGRNKKQKRCIAFWQTLALLLLQKQIHSTGGSNGLSTTAAAAAVVTAAAQQQHDAAVVANGDETLFVVKNNKKDESATTETKSNNDNNNEEISIKDATMTASVLFDDVIISKENDEEERLVVEEVINSSDEDDDVEDSAGDDNDNNNNNNNDNNHEPIIVISTVDGTLAGLSRDTGRLLWKREPSNSQQQQQQTSSLYRMATPISTGGEHLSDNYNDDNNVSEAPPLMLLQPLVSTSTSVGGGTTNSRNQRWRTSAVPSIRDGKVYLTAGDTDTTEQHVTANVRDLVERAPFVDSRGRMYTGQRQNVVVAVDLNTGEIIQEIPSLFNNQSKNTAMMQATPKTNSRDNNDSKQENNNVLWIGRVDYSVSIHEPRSGELDVQFSSSELLSVHDMLLLDQHQQHSYNQNDPWNSRRGMIQHLLPHGPQQHHHQSSSTSATATTSSSYNAKHVVASIPELIATPSGHVAYRDGDANILWITQFNTPVAYALDSTTGTSIHVQIVPDAILPHGTSEYVSKEIQRQLDLLHHNNNVHNDDTEQETIVGSLPTSGQLFAMPLGGKHKHPESPFQHHHTAASTKASSVAASHSSSAQVVTTNTGRYHPHTPTTSAKFGPSLNQHHDQYHHHHHHHSCHPGNAHYPQCLASSGGGTINQQHASEQFFGQTDRAIVPFYHPDFGYVIPPEQFYMDTIVRQQQHHYQKRQYQKILKVLGSWLPPLIALIFVSSFELGRRKRMKDIAAESNDCNTTTLISQNNDCTQDHNKEESNQNHGIIQVCEDVILGHGGHGTMVYKGILDGRQVAVKRMLKTYHASADREISLLIEIDGHPNVVRYFLKEIRGDFVYLALELCDLSLHELIGHVKNRLDTLTKIDTTAADNDDEYNNKEKKKIFDATRSILYQIVKGVCHLHHNRIIHRDLKPANILLADARKQSTKRKQSENETICDIFENDGYVAKISDMGLGKQIVGQSSYGGASFINDSSLRGNSTGGQSSIIGIGPGSVGWQAPEVMALRMPSDASVKSEGSIGSNDAAADMSPIDVSSSARTSRSVDVFSLGCIFYSTLVPGSHPFGEWYEREANIMHNRPNIEALESISAEAHDLVQAMLRRNSSSRPTAKQISEHPFFWPPDRRLAFLCDFSDRLEIDSTNANDGDSSAFLTKLLIVERNASQIVGTSWDRDLDDDLISNVQRFRTYDPSSVRDLLRLIRNKHHHFDELPESLKEAIGSKTDGLMQYFERKFPRLLIHCFHVCQELYSSNDDISVKYSIVKIGRPSKRPPMYGKPIRSSETDGTDKNQKEALESVSQINQNESRPDARDDDDNESDPPQTLESELSTVLEETAIEELSTIDDAASQDLVDVDRAEEKPAPQTATPDDVSDLILWQGSTAAKTFKCRGWMRSDDEWERRIEKVSNNKQRDTLIKCADDPKFRTRLCNHWDVNLGTFCPMRYKGKCIFAHGPVELRVKDGKRNRWGKLVDENGDNNNPNHSGGEDTYGAARAIESERKQEGKWNTNNNKNNSKNKCGNKGTSNKKKKSEGTAKNATMTKSVKSSSRTSENDKNCHARVVQAHG